jgi:hypothetical protein
LISLAFNCDQEGR